LPVTLGLAGGFVAWAMLVPLADATCALALTPRVVNGLPTAALAAAGATVPLTATLVLSRSPVFGTQLGIFGILYSTVGAGAALGLGGRARAAPLLWAVWALIESVFGLAAGFGLNMAAGSLVSDELDATESEWSWLASLVSLNWFLSIVSAVVAAFTVCAILRPTAAGGSSAAGDGAGKDDDSLGLELLAPLEERVDLSVGVFGDARGLQLRDEALRSPPVLVALGWFVLLVCGTVGFFVTQLDPPGLAMGDPGWLDTPCKGCTCSSTVTVCAAEGGTCACDGAEASFVCHFLLLNPEHLPRQARDKHRKR
jgi:hypothetical protein